MFCGIPDSLVLAFCNLILGFGLSLIAVVFLFAGWLTLREWLLRRKIR